jgi:hypothetical protein
VLESYTAGNWEVVSMDGRNDVKSPRTGGDEVGVWYRNVTEGQG